MSPKWPAARSPWPVIFVSLFAACTALLLRNPMNGDVAFYLWAAGRISEGAKLYRDIIDPNPPLVYYFNLPAVFLSKWTGWTPEIWLQIGILGLVALSWWLCARAIESRVMQVMLLCVMLPLAIPDFGEREHLMFLLVMPWIVASARKDSRPSLALGLMAGVGIALKPFFVVVWLAMQASRRGRWFTAENLAIPAANLLYVGWILLVTPEYLWVAKMGSGVYSAFNTSIVNLLASAQSLLYFATLALCAVTPWGSETKNLRKTLLWASAGFLLLVLLQGKGYGYHFYPLRAVVPLLIAIALIDLDEHKVKSLAKAAVVIPVVGIVVLQIVSAAALKLDMPKETGPLLPLVRDHAPPGSPVLVLSTSLWPGWPLINYTQTRYVWRMAPLWTLPGLYPERPIAYRDRTAMSDSEKYIADSLVEDMSRTPPRIVIEERGPEKEGFRGGEFDYIEYFRRDQRFARMWAGYDLIAEVTRYRVYKRR